jgi:hypothetical protein
LRKTEQHLTVAPRGISIHRTGRTTPHVQSSSPTMNTCIYRSLPKTLRCSLGDAVLPTWSPASSCDMEELVLHALCLQCSTCDRPRRCSFIHAFHAFHMSSKRIELGLCCGSRSDVLFSSHVCTALRWMATSVPSSSSSSRTCSVFQGAPCRDGRGPPPCTISAELRIDLW